VELASTLVIHLDDVNQELPIAWDEVNPYFYILGSINGRDELIPTKSKNDNDNSWILHPMIVECKHHMQQIQGTPSFLYEQIQAAIFCMMYEIDDVDIVQVLQTGKSSAGNRKKDKASILNNQL